MNELRVSLVQTNVVWENIPANISAVQRKLKELCGKTDLAVLPEMFSTGFTMKSRLLAEATDGRTISALKAYAETYHLAIAGSFISKDKDNKCYNRGFFISPDKKEEPIFIDKKHLFRMGHEDSYFDAGTEKKIIHYKGWNICLLICYDLRFPVWSRNVNNEYDLLIYSANWPVARKIVWDTLLKARALENESYVCGVNRVGKEGKVIYDGGSVAITYKGEVLATLPDQEEGLATVTLSLSELQAFREKFPCWMDADKFKIL